MLEINFIIKNLNKIFPIFFSLFFSLQASTNANCDTVCLWYWRAKQGFEAIKDQRSILDYFKVKEKTRERSPTSNAPAKNIVLSLQDGGDDRHGGATPVAATVEEAVVIDDDTFEVEETLDGPQEFKNAEDVLKKEGQATLRALESLGLNSFDLDYLPVGVDPATNITLESTQDPLIAQKWLLLPTRNETTNFALCVQIRDFWMSFTPIGFNFLSLPQTLMFASRVYGDEYPRYSFDDVVATARVLLPDAHDPKEMMVNSLWAGDDDKQQDDEWMETNTAVIVLRQSAFMSTLNSNWLHSGKFGINLSDLATARKFFLLSYGGAVKSADLLRTYAIEESDAQAGSIPWKDAKGETECLTLPKPSRRQFTYLVPPELRKSVKTEVEDKFVDSVEDLAAKDFQRGSTEEHQEFWGVAVGFKELPAWTRLSTEKQRALREEVQEELKGAIFGLFYKDVLPQYAKQWCYCTAWSLRSEAANQKEKWGLQKEKPALAQGGGLRLVHLSSAAAACPSASPPKYNFDLDDIMNELGEDSSLLPQVSPLSPNTMSLAFGPPVLDLSLNGSPSALGATAGGGSRQSSPILKSK